MPYHPVQRRIIQRSPALCRRIEVVLKGIHMTTDIRNKVAEAVDDLTSDILSAASTVPNPRLLEEQVREIGKLLIDPDMRRAAPVSQLWRLLMGLRIAGALTEDELYALSGRFRDLDMRLYPVEED